MTSPCRWPPADSSMIWHGFDRYALGTKVTGSPRPILIVNADDLGSTASATERILTCHREGAITSATAMVYMEDSDRAAGLAQEANVPVGLHINLTERFTARDVPRAVRDRQARIVDALGHSRTHKWLYDLRIKAEVDRSLRDQLTRFLELYGQPPTHFDSHHHLHSCPNIFLSRELPSGARIRNTMIWSRRRSGVVRRARQARQRLMERRLRSPSAIVCLDVLVTQHRNSPHEVARAVLTALPTTSAEVMAHPGEPAEFAFLMSEPWSRILSSRRTGSFDDLY
jgi:chitin disaccharide deacetylase